MTVRLMCADSMKVDMPHERRREPRYSARIEGRLRSSQGDEADVLVAEISMHGCRIRCAEGWLRKGQFVSIALGDNPPLEAILRWTRDGSAGAEFLWPIPPERTEWMELADLAI